MRKMVIVCGLAGVAAFGGGCASPAGRNADISQALVKEARPDLGVVAAAAARFREGDFSDAALKTHSDGELDQLYEALYRVNFYYPGRKNSIVLQRGVLEERLRRKRQTNEDGERMHKVYIGARMFEDAAAIGKLFPGAEFPAVPELIVSGGGGENNWRVYDISDGGKRAELRSLPLAAGRRIIMEIFTGCPTAEKALGDILADPALADAFRKYGLLVTDRFDAVGVLLWREHFKFPEVYIAHRRDEFPGVNFRTSPNFYFLDAGEIKHSFFGWADKSRPDSGAANLLKGLRAISVPVEEAGHGG